MMINKKLEKKQNSEVFLNCLSIDICQQQPFFFFLSFLSSLLFSFIPADFYAGYYFGIVSCLLVSCLT
jgi:hypothetical protein